jgi:hypothetical protein
VRLRERIPDLDGCPPQDEPEEDVQQQEEPWPCGPPKTYAERLSDDGTRDGFECDDSVQELREELFTLSQDQKSFDYEAGAYFTPQLDCLRWRAQRPMITRMREIHAELDALAAADTTEFFGDRILDLAEAQFAFAK